VFVSTLRFGPVADASQLRRLRYRDIPHLKDIREYTPGGFIFRQSSKIDDELASLAKFLEVRGGRALSIGNYKEARGIPTVDAVYFSSRRSAPMNLSIKSSTSRERTNAMNFIKNGIDSAKRSIEGVYSYEGYARFFSIEITSEGRAFSPFGSFTKAQRRLDLFHEVLGVVGVRPDTVRQVGLVLDLSLEVTQSPILNRAGDVLGPGPKPASSDNIGFHRLPEIVMDDVLLRVLDSRVFEQDLNYSPLLNLSDLQRRIRSGASGPLKSYHIMFADRIVEVDADRIQVIPYYDKSEFVEF
jgi:hypothetical protein